MLWVNKGNYTAMSGANDNVRYHIGKFSASYWKIQTGSSANQKAYTRTRTGKLAQLQVNIYYQT